MEQLTETTPSQFIDRRQSRGDSTPETSERRQFRDSHANSRPEIGELAEAIDLYKMRHRRRFITFEELFNVITELGYHK